MGVYGKGICLFSYVCTFFLPMLVSGEVKLFHVMNTLFTSTIGRWFTVHGRSLPWRETRDPYKIWISETILQQTRVAQGLDYYHRFLASFPDVFTLAKADEAEVLLLWQGLGYYSRARNLHEASRQIAEMGAFPADYAHIRMLKGVGDYTAAAIASFAFDLPYAVLDGNVYRVLSRYLGVDTPIDSSAGHKEFRMWADEMLDRKAPALYNQAIMDFGAMVCTPKSPDCMGCPLRESCVAYAENKVMVLPVKSRKQRVRDRFFTYYYIKDVRGDVMIQRRSAQDIWKGLYQLPLVETAAPLSFSDAIRQIPAAGTDCMLVAKDVVHRLSHQVLHADVYRVEAVERKAVPFSDGVWIRPEEISEYAMPQLLVRILEQIM